MLYAHWEGYTKNALNTYWRYVAKKGLAYRELSLNFVALGIEREIGRIHGASYTERQILRIQRINACSGDRALLSDRDIDTQSNLNSAVLADLMLKLGLDSAAFSTKGHFIDFVLLRSRNSIAHGEYLDVDVETYVDTHREALGLMEAVRSSVSNAASTAAYRR